MKAIILSMLTAVVAGELSLVAQQPADPTPVEAESPAAAAPSPTANESEPALIKQWREEVMSWDDPLRIEKGVTSKSITVTNRSVLILGTVNGNVSVVSGDIAVLGDVNGNVSTSSGSITVLGTVNGEAKTVSGDLRVGGKVTGSTSVSNGKLETAPGAQLLGSSNSSFHFDFNFNPGSANGSFNFDPGESEFFRDFWLSKFMLLWRSGLLIFWLAIGSAMAALFQPAILRAGEELRRAPARCAALGFLWTFLFWFLLVVCAFLSLMLIGIPLVIVLIAFQIALSVFGVTLVFSVVGERVARRLNHPNASIYAAVFAGACFLGLLRLVPVVGSLIWFVVGLCGVGATLASRFGSAGTPTAPTSAPALPVAA